MRHALLVLAAFFPQATQASAAPPILSPTSPPAQSHARLVKAFVDWRAFNHPAIVKGRPDYSALAMRGRSSHISAFRTRLASIDRREWSTSELNDARLFQAEINGLEFFHRVLRPWARDPGFYQTVFAEMSDVPAHEGPSAEPNIDLHNFGWPLSPADDARLTELLGAVPGLLADAKINLVSSKAHDLWEYGDRAFIKQAESLAALEAGTLSLNDLGGKRRATLNGTSPALRSAVQSARLAT